MYNTTIFLKCSPSWLTGTFTMCFENLMYSFQLWVTVVHYLRYPLFLPLGCSHLYTPHVSQLHDPTNQPCVNTQSNHCWTPSRAVMQLLDYIIFHPWYYCWCPLVLVANQIIFRPITGPHMDQNMSKSQRSFWMLKVYCQWVKMHHKSLEILVCFNCILDNSGLL